MRWNLSTVVTSVLLGVFLTTGLAFVTRKTGRALDGEALLQQEDRAKDVATQLDTFLLVSAQIADSTAMLVAPLRGQAAVEELLRRMLSSTPPEFVYGIGVWFEPYRFDRETRYFGPYLHRAGAGPPVLTYEWTTPQYDYPSRPWYQLGRAAGAKPAFTEPYFDTDYVYMTTTRAIFGPNGEVVGVVSVDLILPQLRELVGRANRSPTEEVFVTTRQGALFAHPEEERLLAWAHARGIPTTSLLSLNEKDLKAYRAEQQAGRGRFEVTREVSQTGWQVHVSTDHEVLFAASQRLRYGALGATLLLWSLLLAGTIAEGRRRQARELEGKLSAKALEEASLRENVAMRDEFLSIASHELKTPLTPLLMHLQLAEHELHDRRPLNSAHVDHALKSARRLHALVEDLLDITRVQTGRLSLQRVPMSLTELVRDTLAQAAPVYTEHEVIAHLPPGELVIDGDRSRLEQVVSNLLENAVKYSPKGGRIQVALQERDAEAVLTVTDQGIGIPADQQPHLFERYFRARNAPVSKYGGLGLGLFVSREVVERHGGRIWVSSAVGEGATFGVSLPLTAVPQRGFAPGAVSVPAGANRAPAAPSSEAAGCLPRG